MYTGGLAVIVPILRVDKKDNKNRGLAFFCEALKRDLKPLDAGQWQGRGQCHEKIVRDCYSPNFFMR